MIAVVSCTEVSGLYLYESMLESYIYFSLELIQNQNTKYMNYGNS